MICIYHSKDLDGYCSGAIVKRKFPEATLIGYDYNEPFDIIQLVDENVIMVDVSMNMSKMNAIAAIARGFTWIDHHASVIEDFKKYKELNPNSSLARNTNDFLMIGIAACEIAWGALVPDEPKPYSVELLGKYDTWRNGNQEEWDNIIMPFQYGMRLRCDSPETFDPELFELMTEQVERIREQGEIILEYQKQQNERACRYSFETTFEAEGWRAVCLNIGGGNSQMFETVYNPILHDLMIPFYYSGRGWTFSLYTTHDHIDCAAIAKRYGGGGHKKAAGFKTQILPDAFILDDPETTF